MLLPLFNGELVQCYHLLCGVSTSAIKKLNPLAVLPSNSYKIKCIEIEAFGNITIQSITRLAHMHCEHQNKRINC